MRVAVIVVNYNDAKETVEYVKKISQFEKIQRIVIVDNLSTNPSEMDILKQVENDKISVILSGKNGGYSYGNNCGVRFLEENNEEFDYLIISNADIEIDENAINRCLDVLENDEKVAVVAPRMYNSEDKPIRRSSWKIRTPKLDIVHSTRLMEVLFYSKLRDGEYSEKDYEKSELEVDVISGAFFIVRYDLFREIGMFDENVFLFYEEDILASKLKEKGYKIVSVNDIKFIHYESQSIGKAMNYYRKKQLVYQSRMYYQKKYNHINFGQILIFGILNIFRKLELIFEIPIRKILGK